MKTVTKTVDLTKGFLITFASIKIVFVLVIGFLINAKLGDSTFLKLMLAYLMVNVIVRKFEDCKRAVKLFNKKAEKKQLKKLLEVENEII